MPEKKGNIMNPGRSSQTNEAGMQRRGSDADLGLLTAQDLNSILEVNTKALTIYLEVEGQNEKILKNLQEIAKLEGLFDEIEDMKRTIGDLHESVENSEKKTEDIDRNLWRLNLILGSGLVTTVIAIVQSYFSHK